MVSIPTRFDKQNVLGSVKSLPDQVQHAWEEAQKIVLPDSYRGLNQLVISGMGGSLLGARVIESVYGLSLPVPLTLINSYDLPVWVNNNTLIICSSYSGTTEETLSTFYKAKERNAKIIVIAAGGKLLDLAKSSQLPYYQINPKYNPSNQPRMALGYSIIGQLALAMKAGLLKISLNELSQSVTAMKQVIGRPEKAEKLARLFVNKQIILTAAGHLTGSAHAIKNQLNENAKHLAYRHDLPELNHHLMEGLKFPETNPQNTAFWLINSQLYSPRLSQRLAITVEVIKKNQLTAETWAATAPSKLAQAFELIQLGALVSFYLSQLHQIDPAAIPWVNYFKNQLSTFKVHP